MELNSFNPNPTASLVAVAPLQEVSTTTAQANLENVDLDSSSSLPPFVEHVFSEQELAAASGEETATADEGGTEDDAVTEEEEVNRGNGSEGDDDDDDASDGKSKKVAGRHTTKGSSNVKLPKETEKTYQLEKQMKPRTRLADKRGTLLKKTAIEMAARTGANVYLKAQYFGARTLPYNFCFGEDFLMKEGLSKEKKN